MWALFRAVASRREGNFGMLTALLAPVIIIAAGSAVDLSQALLARSDLQGAADAAALGAINPDSSHILEAMNNNIRGNLTQAEKISSDTFLANAHVMGAVVTNHTSSVKRVDNLVVSTLTYTARIPTTLMRIAGISHVDVSGVAEARSRAATMFDFNILMDNSPSMGIGATIKDIEKLEKEKGCAFACHNLQGPEHNSYAWAKAAGVVLRVDVVGLGIKAMVDSARKSGKFANQYRMALYTFGKRAEEVGLTRIVPMTYDLKKVGESAQEVKLMSIPHWNFNSHLLTDFDATLIKFKERLTRDSSRDREQVLILITDAMNDSFKSSSECKYKKLDANTCWQPIDPQFCDEIKKSGVRVAVLYTTFWPLQNDENYRRFIKPWYGEISTSAKACASEGLFFEVSPTEGIEEAMRALFNKVVNQVLLTR